MTTTAPALAGDPAELPDSRRRPLGVIWSVIRSQPQAAVGTAILVLVVLVAIFAPVIAPYGEREVVGEPFEAPSGSHWLGLDDGGVDMVTLLIWGARVSLIVGFAAALVAMLIGGAFGILAGYFGGKLDIFLMRLTDYFLVIPDIALMIAIGAIWGRSLRNIILIIGIVYWPTTARLLRAQVKSVRERVYVKRARSLGASNVAHHLPARPAASGASPRGQHGPDGRDRDLRRDRARLPRSRRPQSHLLGEADRERLRGERDLG